MRVAHRDDYDTHAVIGGNEVMEFGISQTAEFFTVLSDTLYSNKPLAVVREVLCNAWDAHIASERTDRPVIVTTTNDKLTIRDFGYGIPHNLMVQIYCIYGASTKENDGKQTGGFGLGSKSPFAYSDHFTVTNCHGGTKKVNAISRGSALTKGKPDIRVMVNIPTTEEGVEVSIPIKTEEDRKTFHRLVTEIASYGEMNVQLDGHQIEKVQISKAENGVYITNSTTVPNSNARQIMVRYGNVIYPVEAHEEVATLHGKVVEALNNIPSRNSNRGYSYYGGQYRETNSNGEWKIVLAAPPHSISVTPSRESISMSETTINTINRLLKEVLPHIRLDHKKAEHEVDAEVQNALDVLLDDPERSADREKVFHAENIFMAAWKEDFENVYGNIVLDSYQKLVRHYLAYREKLTPHEIIVDHMVRAERLLKGKPRRPEALKRYLRLFSSHKRWGQASRYFYRTEQQRLLKQLHKAEVVSPKNLHIVFPNRSDETRRGFVEFPKASLTSQQMLPFLQGVVIITHSKLSFTEQFREHPESEMVPRTALRMVYTAPRAKDHREKAINFFTQLGFHVIDFAGWLDENNAEFEASQPKRPVVHTVGISREPRKKGLPSLKALMTKHGFSANRHNNDGIDTRTETFTHIVQPTTLSGREWQRKFFPWGDRNGHSISHLFGDRIGIVVNTKQHEKYSKAGKKDGFVLIAEEVSKEILTNPRIRNYVEVQRVEYDAKGHRRSSIHQNVEAIIQIARISPVIGAMFNIPDQATNDDLIYLRIFEEMKENARFYTGAPAWVAPLVDAKAEYEKWTAPAYAEDIRDRLSRNQERIECLDLDDIRASMAAMKDRKNPDIGLRIYMETILLNALQ